MEDNGGPYLLAAVLCQKVERKEGDVLSLIDVTPGLVVEGEGDNPPDRMPEGKISVTLLCMLCAGKARGRGTLSVRPVEPSGLRLGEIVLDVQFRGEEAIITQQFDITMTCSYEGVYWFEVLLDGAFLTKVPLRMNYRRAFGRTR